MGHAKDAKIREKIRSKATELSGTMIFELRNHDIFEFQATQVVENFAQWAVNEKHVKDIEYGRDGGGDITLRIAIKYEKS
jgi:hypothetical protein